MEGYALGDPLEGFALTACIHFLVCRAIDLRNDEKISMP